MKALIKEAPVPEGTVLIRIVSVRRTPTQTAPRLLSKAGCQELPVVVPPHALSSTPGALFVPICCLHNQPPENACASPARARTWGGGSIKPPGTPFSLQGAQQLCSLLRQRQRWGTGPSHPRPLSVLHLITDQ